MFFLKNRSYVVKQIFGLRLLYMYGLVHKEFVGSLYSYYDLKWLAKGEF